MEGRLDSLVTYGTEWWANLSVCRFRQLIRRCWEEALEAGREGVRDIARRGADGDVDGTLVDGNGGRAAAEVVGAAALKEGGPLGPVLRPCVAPVVERVRYEPSFGLFQPYDKLSVRTKFLPGHPAAL